ncbi:MAG: hypothetical protein KF787_10525 [Phycisphaeraceae bacterium]|nr:hypothetical protein [Phycisphaerae bacterium]MBX3393070.1 hypothetical protein [Phycisphaeraceae bacterium]
MATSNLARWLTCLACALPGTTAGRAPPHSSAPWAVFAPGSDPVSTLRDAAELQMAAPARPTPVPIPEGINPSDLEPIEPGSPAWQRASARLADILAEAHSRPAIDPAPLVPRPPEAIVLQALRLYAQGRGKAAAGDHQGAITDLDQATRLDPSAHEPWRELGDAQTAAGRRLAAIGSYTMACSRGSDDPRVWWIVGRDAIKSAQTDKAVSLLARAQELIADATDPALEYLVAADLSEALLAQGRLRAAIESGARAGAMPIPLPWATRLRTEVIDLARRRSELLRMAADAAVRLGDAQAAVSLYELAEEDGEAGSPDLLRRRMHALWSTGRPLAAAWTVVRELEGRDSPLEDTHLAVIRHIARSDEARTLMADAIRELADRCPLPGDSARRQWERAIAAATPGEAGRSILRQALARSPEADDVFWDLIATHPRNDPRARVTEFVRLVEQSPRTLVLIGTFMLTSIEAEGELAEFERSKSWVAHVARIRWLVLMGRFADALDTAQKAVQSPPGFAQAVVLATRVHAMASTGRYDLADDALADLHRTAPDDDPLLLARALSECQRFSEAFEILPAASSESSGRLSAEQRLAATGIALRAGRADAAEQFAISVLGDDPYAQAAYETLIGLYAAPSPLADDDKLARAVRLLRQAAPEGRAVRWLTAQEMMARRMDTQARASLTRLANEGVLADSLVSMLSQLLERRATQGGDGASEAVTTVRRLVATYPESPALWTALARVLVAAGLAQEADTELASRLAKRPWPSLASARESLNRDALHRPEVARSLALDRLSPSPRPIELTIAYAAELAREGRLSDAAAVLREELPARCSLTIDQQNRVGSLITGEFEVSDRPGVPPVPRPGANHSAILDIFDVLVTRGARLAPPMHQARVFVLIAARPVDISALRSACSQAERDAPAAAPAIYALAAQELANTAAMPGDAVWFLRRAILTTPDPNLSILIAYFSLVAEHGSIEDIADLEDVIGGLDGQRAILQRVMDEGSLPTDPALLRAEFFYQFGGLCTTRGRRELAEAALLKALDIHPDHPMACNDLGYYLVEDGRNQALAERLLVRAYTLRPDSHNVIDSFAWLRYMQGRIEDWSDPVTGSRGEGAASLLERAAAVAGDDDNATILDHLGDALWRAGRRDDALAAWRKAQTALTGQLDRISPDAAAVAWRRAIIERSRAELERIQAKIAAALEGHDPPVAPMHWVPQDP